MQFKPSTVPRKGVAVVLFAIYLVLVIVVPIALSGAVGLGTLPRGRACPNCAQETLLIQSPALRVAQRAHCGTSLQHRWCPACAWEGYARNAKVPSEFISG